MRSESESESAKLGSSPHISFNPRPDGPPYFPRPVRGRGSRDPSRLLGHVAGSRKKQSQAHIKSFIKYFGHFFTEVNIKVTRDHLKSNGKRCFTNYFRIKKDREWAIAPSCFSS